jgi:hypothetical protein
VFCLRRRYPVTALVCLLISRSLSSNGCCFVVCFEVVTQQRFCTLQYLGFYQCYPTGNMWLVQKVPLWTCIREVLSSNLGQGTDYPDWVSSSLPSGYCQYSASVRLQSLPSKSGPIQCASIILLATLHDLYADKILNILKNTSFGEYELYLRHLLTGPIIETQFLPSAPIRIHICPVMRKRTSQNWTHKVENRLL